MAVNLITSGLVTTTAGTGSPVLSGQFPSAAAPDVPNTVANAAQIPSAGQIDAAVSQVNDSLSQKGQDIFASIEIDKATGMSVVVFTDMNTNEEIGQYPPKAIVAMAESFVQEQDSKGQLLHVSA